MKGHDGGSRPTAHYGIGDRIHVVAERPTVANRQIVGGIGGYHAAGVRVAAGVVAVRIVKVLVVGR